MGTNAAEMTMAEAVNIPGYMEMHESYLEKMAEGEVFNLRKGAEAADNEWNLADYIGKLAQSVVNSKHSRAKRRKNTMKRLCRARRQFAFSFVSSVFPKYQQRLHHDTAEKVAKMEAVARDRTAEDSRIAKTPDFLLEDAQLQKDFAEFDAEVSEFEEHEKAMKRAENMRKAYYNLEDCSTTQLLEMALQYAEDCDPDYATPLNESLKLFLAREMTK